MVHHKTRFGVSFFIAGREPSDARPQTGVSERNRRRRHLARDVPPPAGLPLCWDENPHSTQVRRTSSRILLCFAMLPHSIRPHHRSSFSPQNVVLRGPLFADGRAASNRRRRHLTSRCPTTGTAPVLLWDENPHYTQVRRASSRILLCFAMLPHSIRPHHRSSAQQKKKPRHVVGLFQLD